jgi:hypothetical protein
MGRGEISWKRSSAEGIKIQVYAHSEGGQWRFYWRERRFDPWLDLAEPPLEDWLELLDAVERRINRRLLRPEESDRLRQSIRTLFPEATLT